MLKRPVLIVGGYGVVGSQLSGLLRERYPEMPLLIGGRTLEKAKKQAATLGCAEGVHISTEEQHPLRTLSVLPSAIIQVVNDPYDYLLMNAVELGIPYLDITRWTDRVREAVGRLSQGELRSPVLFSSSWMGGVAAVVTAAAVQKVPTVERIEVDILYSLNDKAGPDSVQYMDRLSIPFEIIEEGRKVQVFPLTGGKRASFPSGRTFTVYRIDTPEQYTFPNTLNAASVSTRISFDGVFSTFFLVMLVRLGIWKWFSSERFSPLRRALLFHPGPGGTHEFVIKVEGQGHNNEPKQVQASVSDAKGQTHLTAVGGLIQLERILGLDGTPPPPPEVLFPENTQQLASALETLKHFGVDLHISSLGE